MNTPAGYQQYEKSKILTASPAELTLMLYEGAIKFANIAVMAIEKGDVEKAHNNIRKVERIIEEFQANIKKDKVIMEEVLRHLRTMRDTWKDVMRLAKTQTK